MRKCCIYIKINQNIIDDVLPNNNNKLFSAFRWDFLLLFDGNIDASPLLAKLSGHLNDGTFQSSEGQHTGNLNADDSIKSSSNEMFVVFLSDDSEAWNGFKIQFDGGKYFKG